MVCICSNGWKGFICVQTSVACNGKYPLISNHILNQEEMASFVDCLETTLIVAVETHDLETAEITQSQHMTI